MAPERAANLAAHLRTVVQRNNEVRLAALNRALPNLAALSHDAQAAARIQSEILETAVLRSRLDNPLAGTIIFKRQMYTREAAQALLQERALEAAQTLNPEVGIVLASEIVWENGKWYFDTEANRLN